MIILTTIITTTTIIIITIGGHSLWFKSYFKTYLPFISKHISKDKKMVNSGGKCNGCYDIDNYDYDCDYTYYCYCYYILLQWSHSYFIVT